MSRSQIIIITSALVLFVALLFANTKMPAKTKAEVKTATANIAADVEITLKQSRTTLTKDQTSFIEKLEEAAKSAEPSQKRSLYDSLAKTAYGYKKPELAAWYIEQNAVAVNTPQEWYTAGNSYYMAARFMEPAKRPQFYGKAIECFERSLASDNNNLKTKTALGVAYVEGSGEPMKGITMLKEVVTTDSNYVEAHINLGLFAEKSGQFDKAIERFNKILSIDPDYIEAYLHLADAYERTGKKEDAIKSLEKYSDKVDDVTIKSEVRNYINQLKNS